MITRRLAFSFFAAALAAPLAAQAQVGGMSSSTAPSNSEGTPSGGTGVIGSTQVGPSGQTRRATTRNHRSRRRHHRHARS